MSKRPRKPSSHRPGGVGSGAVLAALQRHGAPGAVLSLTSPDRQLIAALAQATADAQQALADQSSYVCDARMRGVSWAAIAWATGLTEAEAPELFGEWLPVDLSALNGDLQ